MQRPALIAAATLCVLATMSTGPTAATAGVTPPRLATETVGVAVPSAHAITRLNSTSRGVQVHWWGTVLPLRARLVRKVEKVMTMGSGVAGLVAVLAAAGLISGPAAIPSGVLAAVLTLGRGALAMCNWSGRGVRIIVPRVAPVPACLPR